jgi:uncharacterized repeat protein (TIGR03803 family)
MLHITQTVCLLLLAWAAVANAAPVAQFKVLHNFVGTDGGSPNALIQGADGFFYGSAALGGDVTTCNPDGCGILFKTDKAGNFTVLHVFHATDGYSPSGLVKDPHGNFYGTTLAGGQAAGGGGGIFFRMDTAGNMTTLFTFVGGFACCDGAGPTAHPILASDGNFYGTTGAGGAFRDIDHQGGFGTVYQVKAVNGALTILHSFSLLDGNGIFPNGPLVQAKDGFLYGTTREGGLGGGTVFKIDTAGNLTLLHAFSNNASAAPLSGLIQAKDGFLYGTTEGATGGGTVYRVDTNGDYATINIFDGADGYKPHFGLLQAADGFFYGTGPEGGFLDFQGGDIFRINALGTIRVLHSFKTTGTEGFLPNSELIQGTDGALYGVAGIGGSGGHGTIFRLDQRVAGPVVSVSASPAVIQSGQTSTGTVTLSTPAPTGGRIVTLGAQQGQIVIPATVTVAAGGKTASFTIKTLQIGAASKVRIYASFAGQGVRTVVTVHP